MHVMLVLHLFPFVFRLHFLFVFSYVVGCCFFSFRVRARSPVFFIISFFLCYVLRAIHYFMHWFRLTPMSYTFYAVFCFLHSALLLFLFFFFCVRLSGDYLFSVHRILLFSVVSYNLQTFCHFNSVYMLNTVFGTRKCLCKSDNDRRYSDLGTWHTV